MVGELLSDGGLSRSDLRPDGATKGRRIFPRRWRRVKNGRVLRANY